MMRFYLKLFAMLFVFLLLWGGCDQLKAYNRYCALVKQYDYRSPDARDFEIRIREAKARCVFLDHDDYGIPLPATQPTTQASR